MFGGWVILLKTKADGAQLKLVKNLEARLIVDTIQTSDLGILLISQDHTASIL